MYRKVLIILLSIISVDLYCMDINQRLFIAIKYNQVEEVRRLINNCANIQPTQGFQLRHPDFARGFDGHVGGHVNICDSDSYSLYKLLHFAVFHRDKEMVKLLIDKSPENFVNVCDGRGDTTLYTAIIVDDKDMVELLITKGAMVNVKNRDGSTPLHRAAQFNTKAIAVLLLEAGADKTIKNECNKTAADVAKTEEIKEIINNYIAIAKR